MAGKRLLEINNELQSHIMRPQARCGHVAVHLNRNIVIFGGGLQTPDSRSKYYSFRVIWSYSLDTDRWNKFIVSETHDIPHQRMEACAISVGSSIYMHGGMCIKYYNVAENNYREVFYYGFWKLHRTSQRNLTWTKITFPKEEKVPSSRIGHAGWEHHKCIWLFGGYGWIFVNNNSDDNEFLCDNGIFQLSEDSVGYNNQLCSFNIATQVWKTVKSSGSIPSPRYGHASDKIKANIWLYGGKDQHTQFDDLYEFNMDTLIWTQIQTVHPPGLKNRFSHSFTTITNKQIVLYGGRSDDNSNWILDVPSYSWKKIRVQQSVESGRWLHTGTTGIRNIIIFGGCHSPDDGRTSTMNSSDILVVMFEPKSLLKSCLELVFQHKSMLESRWDILPRSLLTQLRSMSELSEITNYDGNDDQ